MIEAKITDIEKTVARLSKVLSDLGGDQGSYVSMYGGPEPGSEGDAVWFDVKSGLICIGSGSEAMGFRLDQEHEAETYILETYGEGEEIPF